MDVREMAAKPKIFLTKRMNMHNNILFICSRPSRHSFQLEYLASDLDPSIYPTVIIKGHMAAIDIGRIEERERER